MSVRFPDTPVFSGSMRPMRMEIDLYELEYDGEIPTDLNGCMYRCGADPALPPKASYDFASERVNGDGQVSQFRFENGHVDFKLRYVRTEKFMRERAARRALFGAYRNPFTDDPSVAGLDRTVANTAVMWHGHKLYALKEDGLPHEIDPLTLETNGKTDFGGKLRSRTFTAHPKNDPVSGEMVFMGYAVTGEASRMVAYGELDAAGNLIHEEWFEPPYASMMHDFAVSQEHVIFPIMPATSDPERLKAGGQHWAWDGSKEVYIGIMPRKGSARDLRYFRAPTCFSFHTLNAVTEGDKIHLDLSVSKRIPWGIPSLQGEPFDPVAARSIPTRWTFDLSSNSESFETAPLWNRVGDYYEMDRRYSTLPYRHGFFAAKSGDGLFDCVAHIDVGARRVRTYYVGPDSTAQEPAFVARSPNAPEGDGYLMAVVTRHLEHRSELLIFDTEDIEAGPIATAHIPTPLRFAFHGEFVTAEELGIG